jgi:hypothetical protein
MDGHSANSEVDVTDYDGKYGKRWYYRLYLDPAGTWFWEPRLPTPAELEAPHSLQGVSWEPMILTQAEWPAPALRGPHAERGGAITVAEEWFDSLR